MIGGGVEWLFIQSHPPGNQPRRPGIHAVMLSAYFAPWLGRLPMVAAGVKKGIDVALFDSHFMPSMLEVGPLIGTARPFSNAM
ncbi:hypothetical protein TNCV_4969301 [Trichonephila clavipes]|nr:hypothetical protein TNCV_4969301 [Trichonephila clavipes]